MTAAISGGLIMWTTPGFIYVCGALVVLAGGWKALKDVHGADSSSSWRRRRTHVRSDSLLHGGFLRSLVCGLCLLQIACGDRGPELEPSRPLLYAGDPDVGEALIGRYGCGSCHTIPGVRGAKGKVGPPLTDFAHRAYIAGNLSNTPEHLVAWIMDPHRIEPGTAMPSLGVSSNDAWHIASYLYTLR